MVRSNRLLCRDIFFWASQKILKQKTFSIIRSFINICMYVSKKTRVLIFDTLKEIKNSRFVDTTSHPSTSISFQSPKLFPINMQIHVSKPWRRLLCSAELSHAQEQTYMLSNSESIYLSSLFSDNRLNNESGIFLQFAAHHITWY